MPLAQVRIADLKWECASLARPQRNKACVARYVEAAKKNLLPPIVAFQQREGEPIWMGGGLHRLQAAWELKQKTVEVEIRPGGRREALLHAVGANARHGLPRTWADKRDVVTKLLLDPAYADRSDEWFAQQCQVSRPFVAKLRKARSETPEVRRGIDGKLRHIPGTSSSVEEPPSPPLTPREVALAEIARAKAEINKAIRETQEAESIAQDGKTWKILKALRETKRQLEVWKADLDARPPAPPIPDPTDESLEGQAASAVYQINRMTTVEVLGTARKIQSHDRAMIAGRGEGREARGEKKTTKNQLETLHQGRGEGRGARIEGKTENPLETLAPKPLQSQISDLKSRANQLETLHPPSPPPLDPFDPSYRPVVICQTFYPRPRSPPGE